MMKIPLSLLLVLGSLFVHVDIGTKALWKRLHRLRQGRLIGFSWRSAWVFARADLVPIAGGATNFVQTGDDLDLVAPVGGVVSGKPYKLDPTAGRGGLVVIADTTADAGADFVGHTTGVWELTKVTAEPWYQGLFVYFNIGGSYCTSVSTTNILIGCAVRTEANPTTTGYVRLNGIASWLNQP